MYMYEMIVNGSSHYKRAERVRELEDRGGERDGTKKAKLEKDPKRRRSRSTVTSLHVLSPSPNTDVEMSPLDRLWRNLGRRLTVLSPIDPGLGGTSTVAVCHVLSRTLKSITHVQYK